VVARTAPAAVEAMLRQLPHPQDRDACAQAFRSACSWRSIRRPGGRRVVLSDVLVGTERVARLISEGDMDGLHELQRAGQDGMRTIDAVLASAVVRRKNTLRDAAAAAVDGKTLVRQVLARARERRAATSQRLAPRSGSQPRPATNA
jgi:Tfp pilus assembly pilus retraction ATPase PilT